MVERLDDLELTGRRPPQPLPILLRRRLGDRVLAHPAKDVRRTTCAWRASPGSPPHRRSGRRARSRPPGVPAATDECPPAPWHGTTPWRPSCRWSSAGSGSTPGQSRFSRAAMMPLRSGRSLRAGRSLRQTRLRAGPARSHCTSSADRKTRASSQGSFTFSTADWALSRDERAFALRLARMTGLSSDLDLAALDASPGARIPRDPAFPRLASRPARSPAWSGRADRPHRSPRHRPGTRSWTRPGTGSWSGSAVRMKSSARRSHSYFEGVMIFQRGDSMLSFDPTPPDRDHELLGFNPVRRPLHLRQQAIEILLPNQAILIHRMPVGNDPSRPLPTAESV